VVTSDPLEALMLERDLAYVEVPVDREEWRRRVGYDLERCTLVADLVGSRPPERIHEVGVGYLTLLTVLRERFPDAALVGAEHPERAYLSDPRLEADMTAMRVDLRAWDVTAEAVPFPSGSFDVVVFSEILEHLSPPTVPRVLDRLRDLLTPDGRLVVSSPNLTAFYRIASLAFGRGRIMDIPVDVERHPGVYGHMRVYSRGEVEQLAAQAGLRVADWRWSEWERGFIDATSWRGRLLRGSQTVMSQVASRWSCAWVCALERATE
jgi:SAM-dependent methyltransferase